LDPKRATAANKWQLSKKKIEDVACTLFAEHRIELFRAHPTCLPTLAGRLFRPVKSSRLCPGFLVMLPVLAKLITVLRFLRVAEDFVRLVDFLEFVLSALGRFCFVRIVFQSQRPVCLLDLLHARIWRNFPRVSLGAALIYSVIVDGFERFVK
jgi:hypothetical protein